MEKKEKTLLLILNNKIKLINKKYNLNLALEKTNNKYFKYNLITSTKDNIYLKSKLFENEVDLYYYLQGIMCILEI